MVLARMTARLDSLPVIGEEHVRGRHGPRARRAQDLDLLDAVRRRRPRRRQRGAPLDRRRPGRLRVMGRRPVPWWRDAVFYQVYVRSFADSDGDGLGDLPGITSRLRYLRDLGVDAVWITPFYPSPQHDAGYDVADYRDVDPRFGSLSDVDDLLGPGPRPRAQGRRRPGAQPHVVRARVVPAGAGRRARAAPSARATCSGRARARRRAAAQQLAVGLRRPGRGPALARDGRVVPPPLRHLPARPRLAQPRGAGDVRGRAALLARPRASTASGSTSRTACSRSRACATSAAVGRRSRPAATSRATARSARWSSARCATSRCGTSPRCTRSTAPGAASSRSTTATGWPSPRPGPRPPESMARYVRPDELHQAFNFAWLLAPWSAAAFADVVARHARGRRAGRRRADLGAVQPRRGPPPTRYGGGARRAGPGAGRDADDAGAARVGVPLPGRGARARGGRRTPGVPAGPRLVPHRQARSRRGAGADAVARHALAVRLRPGARDALARRCPTTGRRSRSPPSARIPARRGRSTARRCAPGAGSRTAATRWRSSRAGRRCCSCGAETSDGASATAARDRCGCRPARSWSRAARSTAACCRRTPRCGWSEVRSHAPADPQPFRSSAAL